MVDATFDIRDHLTPDQIEDLADGWHVAIVLGPAELDAAHAALTMDYHDSASIAVSNEIQRQIKEIHFLRRMAAALAEID